MDSVSKVASYDPAEFDRWLTQLEKQLRAEIAQEVRDYADRMAKAHIGIVGALAHVTGALEAARIVEGENQ